MKVITSGDNATYKNAVKLLRKKYRDRENCYLLEGRKPLMDALETGLMIEKVFVCDGIDPAIYADLPEELLIGLSAKLFTAISDTGHSQGLIAVIRRPVQSQEQFFAQTRGKNLVILDRLQDPGNAGTIIRTAEAAGFGGIIAVSGSADFYSPKVVRAAAGSLMRMPVLTDAGTDEVIRWMRDLGYQLTVTSLDQSQDFRTADYHVPAALVIGNEGAGVSQAFLNAADLNVHIPMQGKIESLNAAVAAGIVMYSIK